MSVLLYLDSELAVVGKEPGEAVETARRGVTTVVQHWRKVLHDPGIQPVHRIDQPVGGAVILGRTKSALASLHQQFATGSVDRRYLAVVTAPPAPPAGILEDRILTDPQKNKSSVDDRGKHARLEYRTIGSTTHHTILEIQLTTGRHHQIRVQLASRGWHIVGDARYGARRPMRDRSIALCADRITIVHPTTGQSLTVYASLPTGSIWEAVREFRE